MDLHQDVLNVIIWLSILVGALQCFFGYRIFKIILGLTGFFIGVEGGAAVLVGGSDDGIALQPLGISSGTGTGLKVGGSWLELEPAGT